MICEIQHCSFCSDLLQLKNPFLKMGERTICKLPTRDAMTPTSVKTGLNFKLVCAALAFPNKLSLKSSIDDMKIQISNYKTTPIEQLVL